MKLNQIYNEHCLTTMSRMNDGFVDLVVTSPPYDDLRKYNGFTFPFEDVAKELFRVIVASGVLVWVVSDQTKDGSESGTSFRQALYFMDECGFKLHDTMIYKVRGGKPQRPVVRYNQDWEYMFVFSKGVPKTKNIKLHPRTGRVLSKTKRKRHSEHEMYKGTFNEGGGPVSSVWEYSTGANHSSKDKIAYEHPAIFPEKLAGDHILSWSEKGDLVYDPFMGSGTTAKMAHILGRVWLGSEISCKYIEIANKRLEKYLTQMTMF